MPTTPANEETEELISGDDARNFVLLTQDVYNRLMKKPGAPLPIQQKDGAGKQGRKRGEIKYYRRDEIITFLQQTQPFDRYRANAFIRGGYRLTEAQQHG